MSQLNMTWSKGAVPPRFGYFVEGQSNAVGRPLGEPVGRHFMTYNVWGLNIISIFKPQTLYVIKTKGDSVSRLLFL